MIVFASVSQRTTAPQSSCCGQVALIVDFWYLTNSVHHDDNRPVYSSQMFLPSLRSLTRVCAVSRLDWRGMQRGSRSKSSVNTLIPAYFAMNALFFFDRFFTSKQQMQPLLVMKSSSRSLGQPRHSSSLLFATRRSSPCRADCQQ